MKNKTLGIIGIVLGALIIVFMIIPNGNRAYSPETWFGFRVGTILFMLGIYCYFFKK